MGWLCSGSDDAEDTVEPAEDSADISEITIPCTEDVEAYVSDQFTSGFVTTIRSWKTSWSREDRRALPMYLKVLIDGAKSCRSERYWFTILEGPIAVNGTHYSGREDVKGSVTKTDSGKSTLLTGTPHIAAENIIATYTSHRVSIRSDNSATPQTFAAPDIVASLTVAGQTTEVMMQVDMVPPNTTLNLSIPDFPHPTSYPERHEDVWFRIDASTAPINMSGGSSGDDRYFHRGSGSWGCFSNRGAGGANLPGWTAIVRHVAKSRAANRGLYVGTIRLNIGASDLQQIQNDLIALARASPATAGRYIFSGAMHNV